MSRSALLIEAGSLPASRKTLHNEAGRDLTNLDLLRSVAVGLVLIGHCLAVMGIRGFGNLGHFGVLLFFVHTAFVLMLSMERMGTAGQQLAVAFFVRRLFRIFPLSILSVLVVLAFRIPSSPWLQGYVWAGWPTVISNVFLVQNITGTGSILCVLWSLPYELQMYAVLPLLFLLFCRLRSPGAAFVAWFAGVMIALAEYALRGRSFDQELLLTRYVPCFLAGVLAWRLAKEMKQRIPGWVWALSLVALCVCYRIIDALRVYGPSVSEAFHGALRSDHGVWLPRSFDLASDWMFCLIVGILLPLFADIRIQWLNELSRQVAKYSYGTYVSHIPILWLFFYRFRISSALTSAIFSCALIAVAAVVLYHWVEDPAIRFGKKLSLRLSSITQSA